MSLNANTADQENAAPEWPRITVVIPNFNGAAFIEPCISSVVSQGYPNLDLILVDGGSSDESMAIVRKYDRHFSHIISEPDDGQGDALNKGFRLSDGEIMGWINSDDMLMPGSLFLLARVFKRHEEVRWLTARTVMLLEDSTIYSVAPARPWSWLRFMAGDYRYIQQESTYWRRSLWEEAGSMIDSSFRLAVDLELWVRFFGYDKLYTINSLIGSFRKREGQRSTVQREAYEKESLVILERAFSTISPGRRRRYADLLDVEFKTINSYDFANLPATISAEDPPMLNFSAQENDFSFGQGGAMVPRGSVAEPQIDLDGMIAFDFFEGPNFGAASLSGLDVTIIPRVPFGAAKGGQYSEATPATILVAGPIVVTQPAEGVIAVTARLVGNHVYMPFRFSPNVGSIALSVQWNEAGITITGNGKVVGQRPLYGVRELAMPQFRIGCGFKQRYWSGGLSQVELSFRNGEGEEQTWRPLENSELARATIEVRQTEIRDAIISDAEKPPLTSLLDFKGKHAGQRCFLMGSGPSLRLMDLNLLKDEVVFSCNASFLLFPDIDWLPTYYACVDSRVLSDRGPEIAAMLRQYPQITGFFPSEIVDHSDKTFMNSRRLVGAGHNAYFFNEIYNSEENLPYSMFSTDLDDHVVMPYTVTVTMLQLAVYMGFSEIYLIGCDTSYVVLPTVEQQGVESDGVKLELTSTQDDDPNHFDPRYFGAGRKWHNPQVSNMIRHYEYAKQVTDELGVHVYNATIGGKLEVFPRVAFDSLFSGPGGNVIGGVVPDQAARSNARILNLMGCSPSAEPDVNVAWSGVALTEQGGTAPQISFSGGGTSSAEQCQLTLTGLPEGATLQVAATIQQGALHVETSTGEVRVLTPHEGRATLPIGAATQITLRCDDREATSGTLEECQVRLG